MLHHYNKQERMNSFTYTGEETRLGVALRDIGHQKTPPFHSYGPAVRDYWLIHVITAGKGKFVKGGEIRELSAGDCFIIRPMEVTTYMADGEDPWEYYWVGFQGDEAGRLAEYALPENVCTAKAGREAVSSLISFYNVFDGDTDPGELEILAKLYEFLALLKNSIAPEKTVKPDIASTALKYLENNYFRDINISRLASELGVTRSYFTVLFSEKTGKSPYNYLTELRLEKARSLLKNSDLRISEVAYSVGFAGLERFSDMFKRYTGKSPVAYRKSERGEE